MLEFHTTRFHRVSPLCGECVDRAGEDHHHGDTDLERRPAMTAASISVRGAHFFAFFQRFTTAESVVLFCRARNGSWYDDGLFFSEREQCHKQVQWRQFKREAKVLLSASFSLETMQTKGDPYVRAKPTT